MLETVASAIGFLGASFIGISFISGTNRPRTLAIFGTALTLVACILFILIMLKVAH